MVLGIKTKSRKYVPIQVDYLITIQEIKPWPPSDSLKSISSVLLQWKDGDGSSRFSVSSIGDEKIEFGETFRLPIMLFREASKKGTIRDSFQKNCLEFTLSEFRKEKAVKGQLLGSAVINLADYGIIRDTITVSAPVNCKKSLKNSAQPVLYTDIQLFDKGSLSSSPRGSFLDKYESESISGLTNDNESESASYTDHDDSSSLSSQTIPSNFLEAERSSTDSYKKGRESARNSAEKINGEHVISLGARLTNPNATQLPEAFKHPNGSSNIAKLSDSKAILEASVRNWRPSKEAHEKSMPSTSVVGIVEDRYKKELQEDGKKETGLEVKRDFTDNNFTNEFPQDAVGKQVKLRSDTFGRSTLAMQGNLPKNDKLTNPNATQLPEAFKHPNGSSNIANLSDSKAIREASVQNWRPSKEAHEKSMPSTSVVGIAEDRYKKELQEDGKKETGLEVKRDFTDNNFTNKFPQDATGKQVKVRSDTFGRSTLAMQGNLLKNDKLKHLKSLQTNFDSSKINDLFISHQANNKAKKVDISENNGDVSSSASEKKDSSHVRDQEKKIEVASKSTSSHVITVNRDGKEEFSERNVGIESQVHLLKEELREAAALEVSLYSIVAEHGSSANKVHAPARRLSRFYLHASKIKSPGTGASAARTVVSGLVLVSKSCGNDVPRLTFWLSNAILLRAIVSQSATKLQLTSKKMVKSVSTESCDDWEDPQGLVLALEKVEAWIFSRIVESVWWQTLTPYMQTAAAKDSSSTKTQGKRHSLGDQQQGNFSIDLWKKAFKDASERLCPLRAGGHECGCLPITARLVVKQLVNRLDVAMFNAILRESYEEMPTDPVSDPISDHKVLPVPAGKSSFGAGAQLKNAVGNWSRWLTDLFGIDDGNDCDDVGNKPESEASFRAFGLLNALSGLMMLPLEMLAERSIRKEVCPVFGVQVIKRVLYNFVPDEFSPNPIPESLLKALDSENLNETGEEPIGSFPCLASPTIYSPPPSSSLTSIMGELGSQQTLHFPKNGSSLLRKSYTSDDELDELDSSISRIFVDKSRVSPSSEDSNLLPKGKGGRKVIRYQLLRELWQDGV